MTRERRHGDRKAPTSSIHGGMRIVHVTTWVRLRSPTRAPNQSSSLIRRASLGSFGFRPDRARVRSRDQAAWRPNCAPASDTLAREGNFFHATGLAGPSEFIPSVVFERWTRTQPDIIIEHHRCDRNVQAGQCLSWANHSNTTCSSATATATFDGSGNPILEKVVTGLCRGASKPELRQILQFRELKMFLDRTSGRVRASIPTEPLTEQLEAAYRAAQLCSPS